LRAFRNATRVSVEAILRLRMMIGEISLTNGSF